MARFLVSFVLLMFLPFVAAAETLATTDDNRRVILSPDGTWRYQNENALPQSDESVQIGVTRIEAVFDGYSCAIEVRADNLFRQTIQSAIVRLHFLDLETNVFASDMLIIGNLAAGHSTRDSRSLVNAPCEYFDSVSYEVEECNLLPRGNCAPHFRPREDSVLAINY